MAFGGGGLVILLDGKGRITIGAEGEEEIKACEGHIYLFSMVRAYTEYTIQQPWILKSRRPVGQ